MVRRLAVVAAVALTVGCGSSILDEAPEDDPEALFESFWQSYDRYYAHFQVKGVDWDEVYARHRPRVDAQTSEDELFEVFGDMIAQLEDGHVYLVGDGRRAASNRALRTRSNHFDADVVEQRYLEDLRVPTEGREFLYGQLGSSTGYLRIATLGGDAGMGHDPSGWVEKVEQALEELSETTGLIVDLRNNGGGRAFNSKYLAEYFAPDRRLFLTTRSRNGPDHDDFSEPRHWYVEPGEDRIYDEPVVVLTNRSTFSAAEWLTMALRQYDHVVHMGRHTGGGMAMFLPRQLANGWMYTISVQDTRGPDGASYERVGIPPDLYVEAGEVDGRDLMIEEAVEFLED